MNKITEVIVEPSQVYVGSTFLIKVKAINYITYNEIKDRLTYDTLKDLTYNELLKGD